MQLAKRDKKVIWHPYTQMQNSEEAIAIVSGKGSYLFDESGNKYIDAISSWWVNLHGHSHPYIAAKIASQALELEHCLFAGFTHKPAVELAERLLSILPGNHAKIFYSDNGSTAVEVALKMVIQYWYNKGISKSKFIVFEYSYHGDTFGSMAVSARNAFTKPFSSYLFDVITIPFPTNKNSRETIYFFKKTIAENKETIAGFIFEPLILGTAGMQMYDANLLNQLMQICKANTILTIADEVMTGFGRTGKLFACNYISQEPDLMCLSKGITGGNMALGVTSCKNEIFEAFLSENKMKTFFHGHSYTANPIACSAALASLDLLLTNQCSENISRIEKSHISFRDKILTQFPHLNIRCLGTILAIDFPTNNPTTYFNSIRDELYHYFISRGIILRPLGNIIYIMPPYCIADADLQYIYLQIENKLN